MSVTPSSPRRRRLAVMHGWGAARPVAIRSAAGRSCEVLFVCDMNCSGSAASVVQIRQFAEVVDVTGLTWAEQVRTLRGLALDGVVTFSESQVRQTAALSAELSFPGHDQATVEALTDKLVQRQRLAAAGVEVTKSAVIGRDPSAALASVGLPAVLKPRVGTGSLNTALVTTACEFHAELAHMPKAAEALAEEFLVGDPSVAGHGWGDYVSVESVHTPTAHRQVCITGKLPLAEPFRETGMLLPCTLSSADAEAVLALEAAAIRALGVRHGLTHTEIKLTAAGPRIIEVNGRLGGYVPEILKRATGINLVQAAIAVALGQEPRIPSVRFRDVTYQRFLAPPAGHATTLTALSGVGALALLPGVSQVEMYAEPGQQADWRQGTQSHLGIVYGTAPDHDSLRSVVSDIDATFKPSFRRTDDDAS